jgi:hypothetical protein
MSASGGKADAGGCGHLGLLVTLNGHLDDIDYFENF